MNLRLRLSAALLALAATAALAAPGQPASMPAAPAPAAPPAPTLAALRNVPADAKYLRDIPYVTAGHPRQKFDIVMPASAKPTPAIVWIHGGAWITGSKSVARALPFVKDGYAVVAINYRLAQQAHFPAQIQDCKAAIRFLRAHAADYNIDPDHIGAWGESAGGHLAALLGTTGGQTDLAGKNPENPTVSDRVQCVVDYFGPTDLLQLPAMADPQSKLDPDSPTSPLTFLLGGPLSKHHDLAAAANPITYISPDDPPFLIVHGAKDPLVPLAQSKILQEALKKQGLTSELIIVDNAGHGPGIYGNKEVWTKVTALFSSHLKPATSKTSPTNPQP